MAIHEIISFIVFLLFIGLMLALDLGVFNRKAHEVSLKEALGWTVFWIAFSLVFYLMLFFYGDYLHGPQNIEDIKSIIAKYKQDIDLSGLNYEEALIVYRHNLGLEYITGYLIEYALSVDNIFVIILIFSAFNVRKEYYHKILFWGILGAIIMRFIFIFVGSALIRQFFWVTYVFGAFLLYAGIKMFINRNKVDKIETNNHFIVRMVSRVFSVLPNYVGNKFFIRQQGKLFVTPLFIILVIVEFTDLIFAVDSVPAIFSITADPYVVFFSNIFAIIGLRSLFFVLSSILDKFRFLKSGLSLLLCFVGLKMLLHVYLKQIGFSTFHSLIVIAVILVGSILLSLIFPHSKSVTLKSK
ncbi:MAG: TerC/Alx family metal homeostasis membrane protein [Bacteroidales bacterium]